MSSLRGLAALLLLALAGLAAPAHAQSRAEVSGVVTDTTEAGLGGATVVLLGAADSTLVSFTTTAGDGAFRLRRVPAGDYVLQVTFVGFAAHMQPVAVAGDPVDVGRVMLREAVSDLGELVISAERVPMVVKEDTLEYNASAFGVRVGANVEELLRRLPGVEVDRDGTITAQGETVEKVLVDGKEFFGSDPTIATRNLPADAVERVQVYDKKSDMAEFTGVEDGEESKTINLSLKEDRKRGMFGNVEGGVGGAAPTEAARYDGRLSLNRFNSETQLSAIANVNNVNRQGFGVSEYISFMGGMQALRASGGRDGGFGGVPIGGSLSDGFVTTLSGGVNLNHEFSDRTSLRSSLFVNQLENIQDRTILQQQLLGATQGGLTEQEVDQTSQTLNARLNVNLDHELGEGHDVRFRATATATDGALDNLSHRALRDAGGALANTSTTDYGSDNAALGANANLTYRKRLGPGRSLVASARGDLDAGDLTGRLAALNAFYGRGDLLTSEELAQLQEQTTGTFTHTERVAYTEPFGGGRFLQLEAEHRAVSEDQDRAVFDLAGGVRTRNDGLSSAFTRTYRYRTASADYKKNGEALSYSAGVNLQHARLDGDVTDGALAEDASIGQGYLRLLPSAWLRYDFQNGRHLDVRYNASTREPSLRDLQPVPDNSDPLNIYLGNPDLRPEYRHTLNARYMLFDQFTFTNLFVNVRGSVAQDAIARARTVDEQRRQTVMPINADGEWSLSGNVNFGTPIRPLGTKINLLSNTVYNRGLERINGEDNTSRILRQTVGVELENRDKEIFDVRAGARYTFNDVAYSLNPDLDQRYLNRSFFGEAAYELGDSWRFSAELDLRVYANEVFGNAPRIPLLEAEITRSLLNDQVQISLVGLDLLDQSVGVDFTNTSAYIQEERSRGLGRYVMLKLAYNLGNNPGGPTMRVVERRGD